MHELLQGSQAVASPTELLSREVFPDSVTGLPPIAGASGSLGEGSMGLNVMNATLNEEGSQAGKFKNQDLDLTQATPRDVQITAQRNDYSRREQPMNLHTLNNSAPKKTRGYPKYF